MIAADKVETAGISTRRNHPSDSVLKLLVKRTMIAGVVPLACGVVAVLCHMRVDSSRLMIAGASAA